MRGAFACALQDNVSVDFRGTGVLALKAMVFFCQNYERKVTQAVQEIAGDIHAFQARVFPFLRNLHTCYLQSIIFPLVLFSTSRLPETTSSTSGRVLTGKDRLSVCALMEQGQGFCNTNGRYYTWTVCCLCQGGRGLAAAPTHSRSHDDTKDDTVPPHIPCTQTHGKSV